MLKILAVLFILVSSVEGWQKDPTKGRKLTYVDTPHLISLKLRSMTAPATSSRLDFFFTTLGFPRFRCRYYAKDSDALDAFNFRVGLVGVVEFTDSGPVGFDLNDVIVRRFDFYGKGTLWSSIACVDSTPSGVTVRTCDTYFPGTAGSTTEKVTISLGISEGYVWDAIHNRTFVPNGFKWDLKFENLHYTSNGTKIAFILAIDSASTRIQLADNDNPVDPSVTEGAVTVGSRGRLAWVKQVKQTYINALLNRNVDLIASTLFTDTTFVNSTSEDDDVEISESRQLVAFTPVANDQPTAIEWDPSVLVDDSGAQALTVSSASILCLFASLFYFLY